MSTIEVDKVIPQSGTSTQIGENGDTINVPSGATLNINSGATIANNGTATGFSTDTNDKVKVSSNDTTAGFLNGKLVAGTNISLTEGSDGGDETLTAAFSGTISTSQIGANQVTGAKLNNDVISAQTELATEPADTDEFLVSDAGTIKRIDYSLIKGGGITMADQFCLTSSFSGSALPIASNLARVARTGQGTINGGMTESSGIFTFPSTGIYLVNFTASFQYNGDSRYIFITMQATTDNSNYSAVAETPTFIQQTSSSTTYATATCSSLIDVTDTSNVKVRFFVSPLNSSVTTRGEAISATYMQFIRLGDT